MKVRYYRRQGRQELVEARDVLVPAAHYRFWECIECGLRVY